MLEADRHKLILEALKEQNTIKIQDLIKLTNASESTIRRDLTQLEKGKFLKRVHGGAARLQGKLVEPTMDEKSSINTQTKRQIAQFASNLIEEGDCIYLDAGSTIFQMIDQLPSNIVVVTNGLMHMNHLLERNIETYLIGGFVKPTTKALIGRGAMESLEQYRFDKSFIGVNGIHPQFGYTTPDPEEAMIKNLAISLSREAYVLADDSKFLETAFAKISDIGAATILTNKLNTDTEEHFQNHTNIKVVTS
ncbi:DeoR/GlpR family DNA-binding transcription regulator [Ornithinibacillus xuwenensis]|uniref:DeoR/GlpR family DNA-binding transcription regulator n=1 Tax=Ornithinibacillus xuwenensis TaxID=3144668 RepID=A0ABU9XJG4_9BACI